MSYMFRVCKIGDKERKINSRKGRGRGKKNGERRENKVNRMRLPHTEIRGGDLASKKLEHVSCSEHECQYSFERRFTAVVAGTRHLEPAI